MRMPDIVLSTHNPSKAEQVRALFAGSIWKVLTLEDVNVLGEAKEGGATLEDNAALKARHAHERAPVGVWTMADDTGIFIRALGGEPGVRSARWTGDTATTEDITHYTLERMRGITDRRATFRTVVVLISPDGAEHFFAGEVQGTIATEPLAAAQPKMPYSPIFIPEGFGKCWAQMSVDEENAISHRGKAFRNARAYLESVTS